MNNGPRVYIEDFCYDLNYTGIILDISGVDPAALRTELNASRLNKMYRLNYALEKKDPAMRNYIYMENCDLMDLGLPISDYVDEGDYRVGVLHEEGCKYYYTLGECAKPEGARA